MNFEFKSTFIKYKNNIAGKSARHYITSLAFNLGSIAFIVWLYLSNHLLPAAIISKSHGLVYFAIALVAIAVKIFTAAFHLLALILKYHGPAYDLLMMHLADMRALPRYRYTTWRKPILNQTQKL